MAVRKPAKARSELKKSASKRPVRPEVRLAGAKSAAANHLDVTVARLEATVAELKSERDRLEAELAAARKKIGGLESARLDAINRIDWVIDSLASLAQK